MDATFYKHLCEEEKKLTELLQAVKVLKAGYQEEKKQKKRPENIKSGDQPYYDAFEANPDKYDKEFTQIQKTIFTIRKAKEGLVPELSKVLVELDNDLTLKKATEIITYHASKFYNLELINATKVGNKNKYYL